MPLRLPFIAVYWYPTQYFAVFPIFKVFTVIIVMTKAIVCFWKLFRLVVFSRLYSTWSMFYSRLKWLSGSRFSPYFVANIAKSSDDSAYQLHYVSLSLKLFYVCNEPVWFLERSDLSWKISDLCWKYSMLPSWDKFETNMLRIYAYSFLTRQSSTLLFILGVFQKLNYFY